MRLHSDLGTYTPSFFLMEIETTQDIDKILGSSNGRVLTHELIHFLQDVTTTFGLINIARTIDELKDLNKILLSKPTGVVYLPVKAQDHSSSVLVNRDLFSIYLGDGANKYTQYPTSICVTKIDRNEETVEDVSHKIACYDIYYGLNGNNSTAKFHFGAWAIYESMAHLIENHIYGQEEGKPSYPYDAASLVTAYYMPTLRTNHRAVAELCEAALMFYNPAEAFISTLIHLQKTKTELTKPGTYYQFVIDNMKYGDAISALDVYGIAVNKTSEQLDHLFTVSPVKEEKWGRTLVVNGKTKRDKIGSISAFLWQVRNKEQAFMDLIADVGFPVAFNSNKSSWIQNSKIPLHTPLIFPAIMSIYYGLSGKEKQCFLYEHCKNAKGGYETNNLCKTAPWDRASNKMPCYYSNIWKSWGLENIHVETIE